MRRAEDDDEVGIVLSKAKAYAKTEAKKKQVNNINAKYDEDKRRFLELTKGSARK